MWRVFELKGQPQPCSYASGAHVNTRVKNLAGGPNDHVQNFYKLMNMFFVFVVSEVRGHRQVSLPNGPSVHRTWRAGQCPVISTRRRENEHYRQGGADENHRGTPTAEGRPREGEEQSEALCWIHEDSKRSRIDSMQFIGWSNLATLTMPCRVYLRKSVHTPTKWHKRINEVLKLPRVIFAAELDSQRRFDIFVKSWERSRIKKNIASHLLGSYYQNEEAHDK